MSVKLSFVPQDLVERAWPLAEQHIKRSIEYADGLATADDYKRDLLSGKKLLWLIEEEVSPISSHKTCLAAGITEIIGSECFVWALGGDHMERWWHTQEDLERWAAEQGCKGLHLYGRKGWSRALRARGYKERTVVLHKELAR